MDAVKIYEDAVRKLEKSEITLGEFEKLIEPLRNVSEKKAEPKMGKWTERHVYADEEKIIEEWQSCKCSVCGRYDTRPYLYYFDEPHFCSWCGADMRGGTE